MLIYISYFQTFFEGINEINSLNMSIHEVAPIFERIKNILNRENKPNSNFCSLNGKYEIQFKNIDFCYKQELGNILGESLGEDLVNEIFSKFCTGK